MRELTKKEILELKEKYYHKASTGWEVDKKTGAVIAYAISSAFVDGIGYSLSNGKKIVGDSYCKSLRKYVGKIPLQMPGTGIIVYRKIDGRVEVLLQLRMDFGKFGLPGGGIEFGETYEECASNELEQETGIIASKEELELWKVYAGPKHITKYPNGDIVYHTVVVFKVDLECCKKIDKFDQEETQELVWLNLEEIKEKLKEEMVFPNNIDILEDIVCEF